MQFCFPPHCTTVHNSLQHVLQHYLRTSNDTITPPKPTNMVATSVVAQRSSLPSMFVRRLRRQISPSDRGKRPQAAENPTGYCGEDSLKRTGDPY